VGDFLTRGMNMEWDTTIFNDIRRLPPAHTLTWQAGRLNPQELTIQRYWQLPRLQPLIFNLLQETPGICRAFFRTV
jgi:asparagine synthase (glutamine-hydrolysing)